MVSLIKSVFTGFQKFRQDQLQMAEVLRISQVYGVNEPGQGTMCTPKGSPIERVILGLILAKQAKVCHSTLNDIQ